MSNLWDVETTQPPMTVPDAPAVQLFTAEQVADAVSAALTAHQNGDDPREAALTAIAAPTETPS